MGMNLAGAWGRALMFLMGSGVFAPVRVLGVLPLLLGTCRVHGGTQATGVNRVACLSSRSSGWRSSRCAPLALLLVFIII